MTVRCCVKGGCFPMHCDWMRAGSSDRSDRVISMTQSLKIPARNRWLLRLDGMHTNYRFRIQPLVGGAEPCFRLAVGMADKHAYEMIPVHRTAFARRLPLKEFHPTEAEVQIELTCLLELLQSRSGSITFPSNPRLLK